MIQLINHILLSMGRFNIEIDLINQSSIKSCFFNARCNDNETTREKLVEYSSNVLKKFTCKQIRYFPNSMKTIDAYIIV